jgi:hypothetical protein
MDHTDIRRSVDVVDIAERLYSEPGQFLLD